MAIAFAGIQFVPYGHNHVNPPVTQGPKWDSSQTKTLMRGACMDCHSNETVWPWYSNIAPVSWLIQKDVDEGRAFLNISELDQGTVEVSDVVRQIQSGRMPPAQYLPIHPEANLTDAQKQQLISGIQKTFGQP
jgi:cytochrome c551/c552